MEADPLFKYDSHQPKNAYGKVKPLCKDFDFFNYEFIFEPITKKTFIIKISIINLWGDL